MINSRNHVSDVARGYDRDTLVTLFNDVALKLKQHSPGKPGKNKVADLNLFRANSPLFFTFHTILKVSHEAQFSKLIREPAKVWIHRVNHSRK